LSVKDQSNYQLPIYVTGIASPIAFPRRTDEAGYVTGGTIMQTAIDLLTSILALPPEAYDIDQDITLDGALRLHNVLTKRYEDIVATKDRYYRDSIMPRLNPD
jgi:hypothetical protein